MQFNLLFKISKAVPEVVTEIYTCAQQPKGKYQKKGEVVGK